MIIQITSNMLHVSAKYDIQMCFHSICNWPWFWKFMITYGQTWCCHGFIGCPLDDFPFVFNWNICRNLVPLRDIRLQNLTDLDFEQSVTRVRSDGVPGLPIYGFLLQWNLSWETTAMGDHLSWKTRRRPLWWMKAQEQLLISSLNNCKVHVICTLVFSSKTTQGQNSWSHISHKICKGNCIMRGF